MVYMNALLKMMVCICKTINLIQVRTGFYYVFFLGGEARRNGHLQVQFKPSFAHMPNIPVWSWNAQPVNLSCIAESIPNATIKWK